VLKLSQLRKIQALIGKVMQQKIHFKEFTLFLSLIQKVLKNGKKFKKKQQKEIIV